MVAGRTLRSPAPAPARAVRDAPPARPWTPPPRVLALHPDRRGQDLVRDPEGIHQGAGLLADLVAEPVDLARDRLAARPGEPSVLLEEAAVGLDLIQRIEVAYEPQRRAQRVVLARVDRGGERLQDHALGMDAGRVDGVVLDGAEDLERIKALVEPALEAPRDRRRDVTLAQRNSSIW